MKKPCTLSIDEMIYNNYKKHCDAMGLIISKQVELFMKKELEKERKK